MQAFLMSTHQWASVKATYHENPRLSEEDIAEARKTMSEAEFNQEYEGRL